MKRRNLVNSTSRTALRRATLSACIGGALVSSWAVPQAQAQDAPAEETPFVTGSLTFAANTHFISYGADVWGAGSDWDDLLFNPMVDLSLDLGGGFSALIGTWWDVNDNADSSIANAVQEVDVWAGIAYATGDWSFSLIYQDWMYASQSERIVDLNIGYSHFLNPSLTLHARVDHDLGPTIDNGLAVVLGIAPGMDAGPVALSFPVKIAAETDEFHGGDSGFSFASAGVGASLPLEFMRGDWSLDAGLTLYHTNDDVIPNNPDDFFLTGSLGLKLKF